MGYMPSHRINVSHPFEHTGIDYAGPIYMKCSKGRGQKSFKGYISVFICMSTKAIHLEAVSDLSTEAFMAALKRFFSRRGKSAHLYSDNGTNFIGALKRLDKEFGNAIKNNTSIVQILATEKIEWHFIPPASPHFGGIWEATVKSTKYHLKRVIGETKLTFEEMTTFLYQTEAVLNSRPLCYVNSGIDSIDVLTPGHFLIGRPLLNEPEAEIKEKINLVNRWELLQKMKSDFWKKWKKNM
ncbi:uncharacterized protein LOC119663452 [Teleopsis dalmanni]|uniref:uncharacterized protein LOC119663452 n=1 Tax=Teleopsis dalmanni TaxID=139649 RepID=UPI0018CEE0C3|nr:uncharacterized protein LOC119663452 [Teleopsis dalmanni]